MVILRAKIMLNSTNVHKVPFLFKLVHRRLARDFRSLSLISDVIWSHLVEFILLSVPVYSRSATASNFLLGAVSASIYQPLSLNHCISAVIYVFIQIKLTFRAILVDALICVPCRLTYISFSALSRYSANYYTQIISQASLQHS